MKLSYRGSTYTLTQSPIQTVESSLECRFLGNSTKLRVAKLLPKEHTRHTLKYRGAIYQA